MSERLHDLESLAALRRFGGPPRAFWSRYVEAVRAWAGGRAAAVLTRRADGAGRWVLLAAAGGVAGFPGGEGESLADRALAEGVADVLRAGGPARTLAVPLVSGEPEHVAVLLVEMAGEPEPLLLARLQLVADTPAQYQDFRKSRRAVDEIEHFANVLDIAAIVRACTRFREAALTLCDQLAARYRCQPVALGWRTGDYVRLQALAQKAGFDRKMELVGRFEAAMEECAARDDETFFPAPPDAAQARAHHELAGALQVAHVASVPLRGRDGAIVGVLLVARETEALAERDVQALRLVGDHVAPLLAVIEDSDQWAGAKLKRWGERRARELWSLEHPWAKLGAVLAAIGLAVLFFGKMDYRVEATFILRPDRQALLPAPFDGFVSALHYKVGDQVPAEAAILSLDATELALRVASLRADLARYESEAEKARGENRFAEMRVALAQRDQAQALVGQAEYRLAQASLRAPFAGVLLDDGELGERIGSPVKEGAVVLRLARLDGLYAEVEVSERDVHEIADGARGEIAFASRPDETFPLQVRRIDPVAQARETGAFFPVECAVKAPVQPWWRPGMTGVAKIEAGRRTFFWVLTHRLVDWLHLKLWI